MPEFESYVDVDVDEFVSSCSKREIKELIECLVEDGHLEKNQFIKQPNDKKGVFEEEFLNKLEVLSTKYYSMSEEEVDMIDNLYNKYR
jgi:hypothetical protein